MTGSLLRLKPVVRQLASSRDGSTTVEFALILPVLVLLMMGTIQVSMIMLAGRHLENAIGDLGRMVRTGQAQGQKMTQAQFRTNLCSKIAPLMQCDESNLFLEVRELASFGAALQDQPVDATSGSFSRQPVFELGSAGRIVLVRAIYRYPLWVPVVGSSLSDLPNGKRLLASAAAFRNEPF
jgi:Flp pilus assembly protein TadG